MIQHLYRANPVYIKWSLRHRPQTIQFISRLFQNSAPLICLLCVQAFTVRLGTVTLRTLLWVFHHHLWTISHIYIFKQCGLLQLYKCHTCMKEKFPPWIQRAFMFRLLFLNQNTFIRVFLKTFNQETVMSVSLSAKLTQELLFLPGFWYAERPNPERLLNKLLN